MPPTLAPRSASMLHAIEGGHGGGAHVNEWMNPEPVPKRSHNVHQPLRPGRSVLWSVQFISPRAGMRDLGVCVFGAFHPTVCIPPLFFVSGNNACTEAHPSPPPKSLHKKLHAKAGILKS